MNITREAAFEKAGRTYKSTICRVCHANCPLIIEFEGGRPVDAFGHKGNPVSKGFYCVKGKNIHRYGALPSRLTRSVKKVDGSFVPIESGRATREIADRLSAIIERHGPRAVATFGGTFGFNDLLASCFIRYFMAAIGSEMLFTSVMIDQPGKLIAAALHGYWGMNWIPEQECVDAVLLVGHNPVVSMGAAFGHAAARNIREKRRRGMKLIVCDPRLTETAQLADIFLQCMPGQDAVILAGMIRIVLSEGLEDKAFIASDVEGVEALRAAVESFTPEYVAQRAGVPADVLVQATRTYAAAKRGVVACSTGPNMAPHGTLTEYLGRCLATICGHRPRAGEPIANPGVLIHPAMEPIAASSGPQPAWGFGEKLRVHGLTNTAGGMPTAALPDEILTRGEGQVRALIVVGGNPMLAFPDQHKTYRALKDLELLVCIDPKISATGELAHYVLAPKLPLEVPGVSYLTEALGNYGFYWGYDKPYAQYTPALVDPPAGSDLLDAWEFLFQIAKHMGKTIEALPASFANPAAARDHARKLDMKRNYTSDEMLSIVLAGSPVPYEEVVSTAGEGRVFDRGHQVLKPKPAGWTAKLDAGNQVMLQELAEVAAEPFTSTSSEYPFLLVSRRMRDYYNTNWHDLPQLQRQYSTNPAFLNPDDAKALNLRSGDVVTITSDAGSIPAVVEVAPDVRRGVVSMSHGWGVNPGTPEDARKHGGCTSRLVSTDRHCDPYSWMARQSAIPVRISRPP
jgi:anaerobic selenocysteine-containing dehydrogenase